MGDSLDLNFQTVRCICHNCGWYRIVGFSGPCGDKRAVIRLRRERASCNLVKAEVVVGPRTSTIEELAAGKPGYHDLVAEAHAMGLIKAGEQYQPLLEGRACPRCNKGNKLSLGWLLYPEFAFARYRCWRQTEFCP